MELAHWWLTECLCTETHVTSGDILANVSGHLGPPIFMRDQLQHFPPATIVRRHSFSPTSPPYVYSSFSATFGFTFLYYPSMMLTIISEYLHTSPSTVLSFPLPFHFSFLYSFFCFSDISVRWTLMDFEMDFTNNPCVYFYPHLCLFLFLFLSSFLMLLCLTFYLQSLSFLSHIVIDCPLAGLYPFLLGSPAGCASYCDYLCQ